ncbi:MAG: hypothetical protein IJE03_06505 [Ruminiclostridium sp.]|nr:hypothetical protein [Ruminiclostridium sp.]
MTHEMTPYDPQRLAPFLRRDLLEILFQNISPVDYAALSLLFKYSRETKQEKLYLKDLASHFRIPMPQVSQLARNLQSKGYVRWTHDDRGQDGTYLVLNKDALAPALEQKAYLSDFFQTVVREFGQDRFLQLAGEAAALEQVMWAQAWKEDGQNGRTP